MVENINLALQELSREIAENNGRLTVLSESVLEEQFHGLNLRQLVTLTNAPVVASYADLRAPEGARVERFVVDGKDEQRCSLAAQSLLLDDKASLSIGDIREVCVLPDSASSQMLVRDHNDIVYRVTDRQAEVDQAMTAALQRHLRSVRNERIPHSASPSEGHIVIANPSAFHGTVGEILRGLAAVRSRNGIAAELEKLMTVTGEGDLRTALALADPGRLAESISQVVQASRQIEALLDGLMQRTNALSQLARQAERAAPAEPPVPAVGSLGMVADGQPDGTAQLAHEPF